MTEPVAANR